MNNNVRRLTDGAMMLAIIGALLLINRQTAGIIETTFLFILPLPMVFYSARYGLKSSVSYFNPYLTEVVGVSAVNSGIFSIINNYLLLLLAPVGGILADKVFKSTCKWLSVSFVILAVLFGGVLLIPSDISPMVASIYTLLPGAVTMMMYGVVFSSVSEAGISRTMTGTVIGISSIIGYLPDSIYSVLFGKWLDDKGAAGYTNIFVFLVASGILGAVLAFWIYRHGKRAQHDA